MNLLPNDLSAEGASSLGDPGVCPLACWSKLIEK